MVRPAPMSDVDPEILAEIRRAALELRTTDPQAAVRVLRRAAAGGGGAEVLARGALGEIYLEELGDLDGAEHEYRQVLALAPGLAAAELGLARVLRETGASSEAQGHYRAAIASLENEVASFRDAAAAGQPIPPGAEEVVLTLLEAALEAQERIDESLLDWAVRGRLFHALPGQEGHPAADGTEAHHVEIGEEDRAAEQDRDFVRDLAVGEQIRSHPGEQRDGREQHRAEGDPFRPSGGTAPGEPPEPQPEGGQAEHERCKPHRAASTAGARALEEPAAQPAAANESSSGSTPHREDVRTPEGR